MSGFASLQPAFTAKLTFNPPRPIGSLDRGVQLQVADIKAGGSFKSEPGFEPAIDAQFEFGSDHVTVEPDMKHVRIDVKAVLQDQNQSFISYSYRGVIEVDQDFLLVLTGSPEARTTGYGKIFTQVKLESGDERLKDLQSSTFIGCSRFVVEKGSPMVVESKISKVVYYE